jgi:hypothetical protein
MTLRTSRLAAGAAMAAALSLVASPAFADGWGGRRHHRGGDDAGWIIGSIIGIGAIAAIASAASEKNRRERAENYRGGYPDRDSDYRNDEQAEGYAGRDEHYVPGYEGGVSGRDYGDDEDRGAESYRFGEGDADEAEPSAAKRDEAVDDSTAALDACKGEVERDSARVESVETTTREGSGWRIAGRVNGGKDFACTIDDDGSVSEATVDGGGVFD